MASLDRAYGLRGALTALAISAISGLVHGVLASQLTWLGIKALLLVVSCVALVIAGTVSARRSPAAAWGIALAMTLVFFLCRWAIWAVMVQATPVLASPPWDWPGLFARHGVSWLWIVELTATGAAAGLGCYAGHERAA
ncbi:MAG: hypothetical protein AAGD47_14440 [Pseudomonadota bacterium]